MKRGRLTVALLATLASFGCGLFDPYCDEKGIYPMECSYIGNSYVCSTGEYVCADYKIAYDRSDCKPRGGTLCRVRP